MKIVTDYSNTGYVLTPMSRFHISLRIYANLRITSVIGAVASVFLYTFTEGIPMICLTLCWLRKLRVTAGAATRRKK